MSTFFDKIKSDINKFIEVKDAEEEVCELYSVYYSTNREDRLDFVSQNKTEIEVDIHKGTKSLTITIDQNPNINKELGQTGAVLWNSSIVMSNFFAKSTEEGWDLTNTNIIELGAGCGLVGITIHNLGAKRVLLTDQRRMMKLLTRNTECNRIVTKPSTKCKRRSEKGSTFDSELLAVEYVWGYPPEDPRILEKPIDIVIASDCVYHEDVAMLLSSTLEDMCRSRDDDVPVVAFVGQELRSDLVHQAFVKGLLDRNFSLYRIPIDQEVDRCHALYIMWLKKAATISNTEQ